jgi:glutathione peroxidase
MGRDQPVIFMMPAQHRVPAPMTAAIEAIPVTRIDGTPTTLAEWAGDLRLVVNVASRCGLTPQYGGLEALYRAHRAKGLTVLGFPANNFAGQEPGSNEDVAAFCTATYGVTFPMFQKISVKGQDQHPLYAALTAAWPNAAAQDDSFKRKLAEYGIRHEIESEVLWNFEKFLLDREGRVIGRFAPDVSAEDSLLADAIAAAL